MRFLTQDEYWKSWALNISTTQGDASYTVSDLMEKIVVQDKLRTSGRKSSKETALFANAGNKKGNSPKKGKKERKCATKGCNALVRRYKLCWPCFLATKKNSDNDEDAEAIASVPDKMRAQTRDKQLFKLKRKMAQMSKNKKSGIRQALLTKVTALLADVMGKPKKKGKNVQIAEEEANFGESLITEVSAPANKRNQLSTTVTRLGKLSYAFKQAKAGAAKKRKQNANAARTAENKAEGGATVNPPPKTARNDSQEAFLLAALLSVLQGVKHRRYFEGD